MNSSLLDLYVEAFEARCRETRQLGQTVLAEPGVRGLLPQHLDQRVLLLATDDRAYGPLTTRAMSARAGTITVFAAATRCMDVLTCDSAWGRDHITTAMVCRDLLDVPAVALPAGLKMRPVRRLDHDARDGVPLLNAAAVAKRTDPTVTDSGILADYLRALPPEFSLFVAVDSAGVVRATAGSAVFGTTASVVFVNTDPDWRRCGIARAMTAATLQFARQAGAQVAVLGATDIAVALYQSLRFEPITQSTRFSRRPS